MRIVILDGYQSKEINVTIEHFTDGVPKGSIPVEGGFLGRVFINDVDASDKMVTCSKCERKILGKKQCRNVTTGRFESTKDVLCFRLKGVVGS